MSDFSFGNGDIYILPGAGAGPIRAGAVQDVTLNFDGDLKEIYGRNQNALDSTRGKVKVSGSIGLGKIDANVYNSVFFGDTLTPGQIIQSQDELQAVPAVSPYTVPVSHGGAGIFDLDMGVMDATTGQAYSPTSGAVGAGQYSVSAGGTYTFASSAAGKSLVFNYLYKDPDHGSTIILQSKLQGNAPEFRLVCSQQFKGGNLLVDLYKIITTKLTFPFKQDDYLINSTDFSAFTNAANVLGRISQWNGQ